MAQPGMWIAGDGTAGPGCRSCGALDEDPWDRLLAWDGPDAEPTATCAECGWTARLGEWDLSGSVAYGAVAVVLDVRGMGPDLHMDTLVEGLLRVLRDGPGGRWTWVHLHI